jgi:UDP-glucose 4-epimerase
MGTLSYCHNAAMPRDDKGGARRVLVTGLSTYWGGRLAAALESNPSVEAIIGVDSSEPTRELERTEFVKVGVQHSLIEKIVRAANIDTVVDTRMIVDSARSQSGSRPTSVHENNVIGTLNILAACSAADSPVNRFVFKSSAHWYGCAQDDPAFFAEDMQRGHPPATAIERDVVEAEAAIDEFRLRRPDVSVTVLRFANVLGAEVDTSHIHLFAMPLVPMIAGFDPRYQFVDEVDVVHALEHVTNNDLPGIFNVAADGVLTLAEVISLLGKKPLPVIPPWGTSLATSAMRRLGLTISEEMLNQMRFGRGLDNRAFKATGFHYAFTSRESVVHLRERLRLNQVASGVVNPYRYEPEVEEFLKHSPHVNREPARDLGREDAAMFDPSPPVQD